MKISLAQHGGQGAGVLLQRPPLVLDTATLDPAAAKELSELAAAAVAAGSSPPRPAGLRDAMSYSISIQDQGHDTVLTGADTVMSPEFAKLLAWLQRHFRSR
ncbi:hypothetical protein JQ596_16330 [Bradyrhizobium manausense]|uniref:protealysin inhibitor emfourin n=1 Tax=Bradyrhizobium TaxID=374 RepID=UPI001BACEB2B|nr:MULTISPECIES: protealysin inhibitor emfourin [Bradyrhizobium]MBR0827106.1 hypothetical protein [Bradyrhizobium manausense]UVO28297.1 hypothetical protein KUF59_38525 [Bradyrhizobium arachidis]